MAAVGCVACGAGASLRRALALVRRTSAGTGAHGARARRHGAWAWGHGARAGRHTTVCGGEHGRVRRGATALGRERARVRDAAGAHGRGDGRAAGAGAGGSLTRRAGARLDGVLGETCSGGNTLLRAVEAGAESLLLLA